MERDGLQMWKVPPLHRIKKICKPRRSSLPSLVADEQLICINSKALRNVAMAWHLDGFLENEKLNMENKEFQGPNIFI
jgi:hypothetical protein